MKILLYFLLFSANLFANNYIDSITLTKIKKLVQKEEEIAIAYKKYILGKGTHPSALDTLKTENYLPKGFDLLNPFGKIISLKIDDNSTTTNLKDDKHTINGFKSDDQVLKSNLYDYYYSDKYRTHTKAPLSINNSDVVFNTKIAEKVVHFCNKYKNNNIYFYIHCTAGISRSAGLGAAISKYYNNDDSWFFKYKVPNRLVYRKTLEAFYSIFG